MRYIPIQTYSPLLLQFLIVQVRAKPFLTRPIQTISSSILTASVSADENSNIEDLRASKASKARQLSKYQNADEDDDSASEVDPNVTNEAVPNLFQKKIDKIMRKLQFVVQLVSRFYPTPASDAGEDKETDFDSDFDNDEETSGDWNSTVSEQFGSRYTNQKIQKENVEKEPTEGNKMQKSRENLGIHFMEILGSLFGLIYGATIQLANNTNARPLV